MLSRLSSIRMMTTSTYQDPAIKDVVDFWFSLANTDWFQDSAKHDKTITQRFGALVEKARLTDELDELWASTPSGALALILLLDQFTRNVFRPGNHPNPGLSWSGDAKALRIAAQSIAKGFDRQVQEEYASHRDFGFSHREFFYLPFMHAEDISSQTASVALFQVLSLEFEINRLEKKVRGEQETDQEKALREQMKLAVAFAAKHRDCIAAVGRFPKRNEPLGRDHTEADKKWLEEHPDGF